MSAEPVHHLAFDVSHAPTEKMLNHHHIAFELDPAWPLDHIDVGSSLANQARIGDALIDEVVDQYVHDLEQGDTFPPLVLHITGRSKKAVVLGGNHRRAAAAKAGLTTFPAYVVRDLEPDVVLAVSYADNAHHGARLTRQDRMHQAAHLVALGWHQVDAARATGLRPTDVSRAVAVVRGTERARDMNVGPEWEQLPVGHRERAASVRSDPVFPEVVKVAAAGHLTQQDLASLVTQVNGARSEEHAFVIVGEVGEQHKANVQRSSFGRTARRITTQFGDANAAIVKLGSLDPKRVAASAPSAHARKHLRERLKDAGRLIVELDKALT